MRIFRQFETKQRAGIGRIFFLIVLMIGFMLACYTDNTYAEPGGSGPALVGSPPQPESASWRDLSVPAIEKLGGGLYRVGEVVIDKSARSISFPVVVNMDEGLLEYLLVRSGGKTHESLFRTNVEPYQIQVAMLLVGAEVTDRPLAFQGASEVPHGNKISISVTLQSNDLKKASFLPEEWIGMGQNPDAPLTPVGKLDWIFTGSVVDNGVFRAQAEGSIIAIYHDPSAIFDNGSPGGESDKVWFANKAKAMPPGTSAIMMIKLVSK